MSAFYEEMAAVVVELLAEFGAPVILERTTGGQSHPVTGVTTPIVQDDKTTTGILKRYPNKLIDGSRIKSGDRLIVIDATVKPEMSDKPSINGETWTIVSIEAANPAGIPLAYFIQARR